MSRWWDDDLGVFFRPNLAASDVNAVSGGYRGQDGCPGDGDSDHSGVTSVTGLSRWVGSVTWLTCPRDDTCRLVTVTARVTRITRQATLTFLRRTKSVRVWPGCCERLVSRNTRDAPHHLLQRCSPPLAPHHLLPGQKPEKFIATPAKNWGCLVCLIIPRVVPKQPKLRGMCYYS